MKAIKANKSTKRISIPPIYNDKGVVGAKGISCNVGTESLQKRIELLAQFKLTPERRAVMEELEQPLTSQIYLLGIAALCASNIGHARFTVGDIVSQYEKILKTMEKA